MSDEIILPPVEYSFLKGLNDQQLEAVLHTDHPLLILAGAGSGKTRVITTKIAWFVESRQVLPWVILAVTFTNKAAREMKERVLSLSPRADGAMVRTFHSFCAWLLRVHGQKISLSSTFSIYDDEDVVALLKSLFPQFQKAQLRLYASCISRAKDYALRPTDDLAVVEGDEEFPQIYAVYQKRLDEIGNVDFGDLILKSIELLRDCHEVREHMHNRFRVLLVDEYQDSNVAQFRLLELLYHSNCYLCVVGDDDQSIYRFRGAEVQNILSFQDHFEGTDIIRLEENYRSTGNVLRAASAVISANKGRLGKELWTKNDEGASVKLYQLSNQDEEAALAVKLIDRKNLNGYAILYRANAQSVHFESALSKAGIPYRLMGALRFYSREEIKDAIAFLALLINPKDEIAFSRIINKPARGIGPAARSQIIGLSADYEGDLLRATEFFASQGKGKAASGARDFCILFQEVGRELVGSTLSAVIKLFIEKSGLIGHYEGEDSVNESQKVANLGEFVNLSANYPAGQQGLVEFLEQMELDSGVMLTENGGDVVDGVVLITMHNTKGLEFDHVIVTGMEEGIFPSQRSLTSLDDVEEERRICYVAMTRARRSLTLTSCQTRRIWGRTQYLSPSRFLKEIPSEFLEIKDFSSSSSLGSLSNSPWGKGRAVYHDDYGRGFIVKNWNTGSQEMVIVRFETGFTGQFFTRYSGLELVSAD